MRVRLVPVRDVFARMLLVTRDVARETGKTVTLELVGEGTDVDKYVVERLADPLLHLVRNAVSHGLEDAAERTAAGKPAAGRLTLRAAAAGETASNGAGTATADDGGSTATAEGSATDTGTAPPSSEMRIDPEDERQSFGDGNRRGRRPDHPGHAPGSLADAAAGRRLSQPQLPL